MTTQKLSRPLSLQKELIQELAEALRGQVCRFVLAIVYAWDGDGVTVVLGSEFFFTRLFADIPIWTSCELWETP